MIKGSNQRKRTRKKTVWRQAFRATGHMVIFALTLFLILAALLAVVYRDALNLDMVKRWLTYNTISRDEAGLAEEFVFSGDSQNSFATFDNGLLLCSNTTLQLYSSSGRQELTMAVNMEQPVIHVDGAYALIYDAGGSSLYVFHNEEKVFTYETQEGYGLISARINSNGYFAVTEQSPGYKATVTVYDNELNKRISWNESTCFIMDALVSPDNQTLAVVKVSQSQTAFETDVVFYRCSDATQEASAAVGSDLVLDMAWKGDRIWLQRETGITLLNESGEELGHWSDELRYLDCYALEGDGYAVELLSKYRSGGTGDLMIINDRGEESVSRNISEEVLSISAAGRYIAVLTPGFLTVYNRDLEEYASVETATARRAIMREDGSVMIIDNESAKLFVP